MIDALNTEAKRANIDEKKLNAFLETVSKPDLTRRASRASVATGRVSTAPAVRRAATAELGTGKRAARA